MDFLNSDIILYAREHCNGDSEGNKKPRYALGGLAVKESHGIDYYRELGVKGGGATLERYSVTYFYDLGKKRIGKH
jgi:hypothetical protein